MIQVRPLNTLSRVAVVFVKEVVQEKKFRPAKQPQSPLHVRNHFHSSIQMNISKRISTATVKSFCCQFRSIKRKEKMKELHKATKRNKNCSRDKGESRKPIMHGGIGGFHGRPGGVKVGWALGPDDPPQPAQKNSMSPLKLQFSSPCDVGTQATRHVTERHGEQAVGRFSVSRRKLKLKESYFSC